MVPFDPVRRMLTAAALSIALAGCGTAVYTHHIEVTVNDPSNRLGPGSLEVSVFDSTMGYSEEWARRTIGKAAPGAPYAGEVTDTATKMAFDTSLPPEISAGLFLPVLEKRGAFILEIRPVEGPEQTVYMAYRSFQAATLEEGTILPLPARFTSKRGDKGWTIKLNVDVPPGQKP